MHSSHILALFDVWFVLFFLCVHSWKDDNSKTLRMERFLKKIPIPHFEIRSLLTLDGCGDARMQHYICSRWVGRSPYFGRPAAPGEINHCRMTHPDGRPMLPPRDLSVEQRVPW